jgi:DNA-binding IclR family transcriptional regulator
MSVLQKASDLIDALGQAGEPVTLAQVRAVLGTPKSSTHYLLAELAALGIVRRTEDGRYSLGPRLLYWGEAAADTFDMRAIADQQMRRLRDELGESIHLYVREHDTRICIAAVEGRHELRPFIQLGRPLPLRVGAAGKLLLAFADEETQRAEIKRASSDPARLPNAPGKDLGDQLAAIRADRWATSVGEREEGISAVATAIVDTRDRVVAALCISAPTTRLPASRFEEMRSPLEMTAAEISRQLQRG